MLLESDQSDMTNVGDGTKSNVLESDQLDTTNVGNETKGKWDARLNQNIIHVILIVIGEIHPLNQRVTYQFHPIKLNGQR